MEYFLNNININNNNIIIYNRLFLIFIYNNIKKLTNLSPVYIST